MNIIKKKLLLRTWNMLSLEEKKECLIQALYNRPDLVIELNSDNVEVEEYVNSLSVEQLNYIFEECVVNV